MNSTNCPDIADVEKLVRPQIKICGLTCASQAVACTQAGADAIGLVFFQKSPRNIAPEVARGICDSLPAGVEKVGVFVNESYDRILFIADLAGLTAVQLHGKERPELAAQLLKRGLKVFKALFVGGRPSLEDVELYEVSGFLVECAKGLLPGGNAMAWNWADSREFAERFPLILAGGLSPENVAEAVGLSLPDAVDVSSSVESSAGRKDIEKVKRFIDSAAVKASAYTRSGRKPRGIF
jgi:phosphoribosylanthranilate isomerase